MTLHGEAARRDLHSGQERESRRREAFPDVVPARTFRARPDDDPMEQVANSMKMSESPQTAKSAWSSGLIDGLGKFV